MLGRILNLFRRKPRRRGNFKRALRGARKKARRGVKESVLAAILPSRKEEAFRRAARRRRMLKWAAVLAVLGAACLGGRELLAKHLWGNAEFIVREPEVKTDGILTPRRLMEEANLPAGRHVFSYDLQDARHRLEENPRIRKATVERRLPGRILVGVEERAPVAWLTCDSPPLQGFTSNPLLGNFLLDEEGVPFPCDEVTDPLMHLPAVRLKKLPGVKGGVKLDSALLHSALRLLRDVREPLLGRNLEVVEIEAPNDWSLQAKFSDDSVVTFGLEDFAGQFDRLVRVLRHCDERRQKLGTANVMVQKNVPVLYAGPVSLLDAEAAPAKPASAHTHAALPVRKALPAETPPFSPSSAPAGASALPTASPTKATQLEEILGAEH